MAEQTSRLSIAIDTRRARRPAQQLTGDLNELTAAGTRASGQTTALSRSVRGLGAATAAYLGGIGITGLVRDVAELQGINSRIASISGDLAGSQRFLKQTAAELSAEYVTLADGYSRLLPLYKAGVLSIREAQEVTRGLANVQAEVGASAGQLGQSMFGLAQGLSSPVLRAEELNQVVEPLPGLLAELDKAAGLPAGGFRELVNAGEVTADFFKSTLLGALASYEGAAARLTDNITQTFNRTKNAYTEAVAAFDAPIAEAATAGAEALADALTVVAENAELITTAVTVAGGATAAALGGQAAGALARYAAAQLSAAQGALSLRAAQVASTQAAAADATSKLASAQAANIYAQAKLRETQAQAASIAGFKRLTFVATELAVAERAAAAATTQLAAAQTAATGSAARLAAAQRTASISGTALAASTRAAAGALALVGGPAGAAFLAAGGLVYLATRQTEAERTTERLREVTEGLNAAFNASPAAAREAVEATREVTLESIQAIEDQIARLEGATGAGTGARAADRLINEGAMRRKQGVIEELRAELEALNAEYLRLGEIESNADFSSGPDRARQAMRDAAEAIRQSITSVQEDIEKLFPDEQKILELENLIGRIGALNRGGLLTDEQAARGTTAAQRAIDELRGVTAAREKAAAEAERFAERQRDALESALPELGRQRAFNEQLALLNAGMRAGGAEAETYRQAIAALHAEFDKETVRLAEEKVKRYTDAISERVATPFSAYRDEIQLFEDALAALPEKAEQINLALARLDAEARIELTVVESADNQSVLAENYARQQAALAEFHAARKISEERAQEDVLRLATDYSAKAIAIYEESTADLRAFLDSYSDRPDQAGLNLAVSFDSAKAESAAIADAEQRTAALTAIEEAYQARVTEIVRAGEGTRAQFIAAAAQDQLAGIINRYEKEISTVGNLADAFLGLGAAREQRQAAELRERATQDAQAAEEAQRQFERVGSEANRIAADQAKARAAQSDAAARAAFEDQKKAQLQQAKLSQLLAIVNAYASGGNFLFGLALAATAYAKTQQVIEGIKAQQYSGGGAALSGVGGGGGVATGSSTSGGTAPAQPTQGDAPQQVTVNILNGVFPNTAYDDVVADSMRRLSEEGVIADADGRAFDTRNVRTTVVQGRQ